MEDQKVYDFLLHELEDVEFSSPIFREIYEIFQSEIKNGKVPDTQFFIMNGSVEVKKVVTDLITARYEISPHWKEKFHIHFPEETEVLHDLAYTNVLRLKFRVVQRMMEQNLLQIRNAETSGSWDDVEKYLDQQDGLKKAERDLASILGIVVAR